MSTKLISHTNDDWVTQSEAARLRGTSRQAIARLIKRGRLEVMKVGGVTFVSRSAIQNFEPSPPGRPSLHE